MIFKKALVWLGNHGMKKEWITKAINMLGLKHK